MTVPDRGEIMAELQAARDTLTEAKLLAGTTTTLAGAVSRLYYSTFYAARAVLWSKGFDAKTHRGTLSQFDLELVRGGFIGKEYSEIFHDLHEERDLADYHRISQSLTRKEVDELVESAERFITEVERLIG